MDPGNMKLFFSEGGFKINMAHDSDKIGIVSNFINFDFIDNNTKSMTKIIHEFALSQRKACSKIEQDFDHLQENDFNRLELHFNEIYFKRNNRMKMICKNIENQLNNYIKIINNEVDDYYKLCQPFDRSLITSLPSCRRQQFHYDYDYVDYPDISKLNYFALIGVDMESMLHYVNNIDAGNTIKFNCGDLVICRGDLAHAGSEYNDINSRMHFYLDREYRVSGCNCREFKTSYYITERYIVPGDYGYNKLAVARKVYFNRQRKKKETGIANLQAVKVNKVGF
jgi:hypothetical protein